MSEIVLPSSRRRNGRGRAIRLLVPFLLAAGCGGDGDDGPMEPEEPTDRLEINVAESGGTFVTPSGQAGLQIPEGAFDGPTQITIERLPSSGGMEQGPLPTDLPQFPLFYDFRSTRTPVGEVVVGLCVVDPPDPLAPPPDAAERLRLAHPDPDDPSSTEILPLADAFFLDCTGAMSSFAPASGSGVPALLSRAARFVGETLLGRPLQAEVRFMPGGLGGLATSFSPFGAVDPGEAPLPGIFSQVAAGQGHGCGITTEGEAFCWGSGPSGALGAGADVTVALTPVPVSGGLSFRAITAGTGYSCGVTESGEAFCWGRNDLHQLGDGTDENRFVPVPVSGGITFDVVSAGVIVTCGTDASGQAHCWGTNSVGQAGRPSPGTIPEPLPVSGSETFANLGMGGDHACAVGDGGSGFCWGQNGSGQLGTGMTSTPIREPTAVSEGLEFASIGAALGGNHSCGVTTGGDAFCWGANGRGQLGDGTTTDRPAPVAVSGGLEVQAIDTGGFHACAVTADGRAFCWGQNNAGQLGDGSTDDSSVPVEVTTDVRFQSISAGFTHTCGVATDGEAWCWGTGGALGNGGTESSTVPVRVQR